MAVISILLAIAIDLLFGDPPNRFHPVVAMGNWLNLGRRRAPGHGRFWFGLGWAMVGMGVFAAPFWVFEKIRRMARSGAGSTLRNPPPPQPSPLQREGATPLSNAKFAQGEGAGGGGWTHNPNLDTVNAIISALFLKPIFAYRNLRHAAKAIDHALANDDLIEARRLLSWHLVSRDTSALTTSEVIGATIESLAENLTDSLAAPLIAYALGGLSAAWAYRFVNTADAMWGYRNVEYEQLGKFPAKLDDVLNWLPARLTGWLMVSAAWLAGEDASNAAKTMLEQHAQTPSPNAGWTMSAMAGACRITLGKRDTYALRGGNESITCHTLQRALRVADWTAALVVATACLLSVYRAKDLSGLRQLLHSNAGSKPDRSD